MSPPPACAGSATQTDTERSSDRAAAPVKCANDCSIAQAPSLGAYKPQATRPNVDLPQPDSPTSPTTSRSLTAKLTRSTACTVCSLTLAPRVRANLSMTSRRFEKRLDTASNSSNVLMQSRQFGGRSIAAGSNSEARGH